MTAETAKKISWYALSIAAGMLTVASQFNSLQELLTYKHCIQLLGVLITGCMAAVGKPAIVSISSFAGKIRRFSFSGKEQK